MANNLQIVPPKKIAKPDGASTYRELSEVQDAFLHGVSRDYIERNTEFINNVVDKVQQITTQFNRNVAASSPKMLVDAIKSNVLDNNAKASKNDNSKQGFVTGVKGLTDLSKDMDLFRELYPIATPMFELFYEYQMVAGMIPEASKCFDILKNSVLSADSFSKQYLIARYDTFNASQKSTTDDITENDQRHVRLIKDIIEEYDLNILFDGYVTDAMMYGAKPVMIIPIDDTFRKSAEQVLRAESANEVRDIIRSSYDAGVNVSMENYIEYESTTIDGKKVYEDTPFADEFSDAIDNLTAVYEDALDFEEAMLRDNSSLSKEDTVACENAIKARKVQLKRVRDKTKRKDILKEFARECSKIVDSKVKFSLATESVTLRTVSKIAGQLKTYRRAQLYNTRGSKPHNVVTTEGVSFKDIYSDEVTLENDIGLLCDLISQSKYEKVETTVQKRDNNGVVTEVVKESWKMVTPDIFTLESKRSGTFGTPQRKSKQEDLEDLDPESKTTVSKKTTGSVIIPLPPDTVVPISVHGKHIGYYVIERLGSDDLGSGVATLLGYRPANSLYSIGMAGHMFTGSGAMTGTDGAGIILRDMSDLPMAVRDDGQRFDLLRSMLVRAISERVGNPDIVDDSAFNSIIFSLIKNNYITKREVRITYVPAHMMVYFSHEIDSDTGIGISVFKNGLFFAHIYIASLITNLMIAISKSADREQVNVEIGSHGRIEATVQKVMRSLQTKRASIDSIGNIDTIMKSLGTFQRYISLRHNGNPLVELETIPGQDISLENTLMEKALQSFINSFYVPASSINQLNEQEYARSITLQNALFLDKIVVLQQMYQECMTKFTRILIRNKHPEKIYNEANIKNFDVDKDPNTRNADDDMTELIDINKIFTDLPSPEGLNISAFNDQIGNVSSFVDSLIDILLPLGIKEELVDPVKMLIKKKMFKRYMPNLPMDEFDDFALESVTEAKKSKMAHPETPEEQQFASSSGSGIGGGGSMGGFGGDMGGMGDLGGDMGMGDLEEPGAEQNPTDLM